MENRSPTLRDIFLGYLTVFGIVATAAAVAGLISGCSTVTENLRDTTFYKRDIELKINGKKYRGAAVVPQAKEYVIEGEVKGGFDFLIIRSCHREYTTEREGESFRYVYVPRDGLEDNRACPLDVRGAERAKGRHSFGLIDFQNGRDTLEGDLECNGERRTFSGTSACQSPLGLIQRIRFPVQVLVQGESLEDKPDAGCVIPEIDLQVFEFKMPYRRCQFVFMEIEPPHRTHRLTTMGYEQSVIREL